MRSEIPSFRAVLLILAFSAAFLLPGCSPEPVETEPVILQVAVTPAVTGMASSWLQDYKTETGMSPMDLRPLAYPLALEKVRADELSLLISAFPPPDGWFATPLGLDAAVVIVHPDNPVRDISMEDLYGIFSGLYRNWEELGGNPEPVQTVILLETDEMRRVIEASFPPDFRAPGDAILAPIPDAVVEVVQEDPGAVGYVPLSEINEEEAVRIIRIDGILPGPSTMANRAYPFTVEIIAASPQAPTDALRDWLNWIQASTEN